MDFMNAYKHLEKLCGEILNDDRRISAYIDEMASIHDGSYKVVNWDTDLKRLKHYRWIRNQIAHEPDCQEELLYNSTDIAWLNNFYSRIMNQTDPLALYAKASKVHTVSNNKDLISTHSSRKKRIYHEPTSKSHSNSKLLIILISLLFFILLITIANFTVH